MLAQLGLTTVLLFSSFVPQVEAKWKWTKIASVVAPGIGTLVGAAADLIEEEVERQKTRKREKEDAERRANEAEERNRQLQAELDELRTEYAIKVDELHAVAKKHELTSSLKEDLDSALVNHRDCLHGANSPNAVRNCYRIYKKAYDAITDTW